MPSGVPIVVLTVNVEVFDVASMIFTVAGLKLAPPPAGKLLALKFTAPVKPAKGVMVTVY